MAILEAEKQPADCQTCLAYPVGELRKLTPNVRRIFALDLPPNMTIARFSTRLLESGGAGLNH